MPFRAEILAIGDELLSGETVDTNSSFLDRVLEGLGWHVLHHQTVPDDVDAIAAAFTLASTRADLILSTGGLGPTADDLTMAGLARALGRPLVKHEPTLERIRERFRAFGREMTPNNEQQAMVPERGDVLDNESGTAPSFTSTLGGATVFLMPGVPREVRWLLEHQIVPRIPQGEAVVRRTLKVMGLGESKLEHTIKAIVKARPEIHWGYRTLGAENHVKMLARGVDARARIEAVERELQSVLGPKIYGADDDDLPKVVGAMLAGRHETVAVAESCTGGLAAKLLTDVPGASAWVLGGIVAYANAAKVELAGVRIEDLEAHGAVSEIVARQLAEGVRRRLHSTYGVSTTGVAGPGGGTPEKPVGAVWIAVASATRTEARLVRFPGDRELVRLGSAMSALDLLRLFVHGEA